MNKRHVAWWSWVWFLNTVNLYFHVLLFLTPIALLCGSPNYNLRQLYLPWKLILLSLLIAVVSFSYHGWIQYHGWSHRSACWQYYHSNLDSWRYAVALVIAKTLLPQFTSQSKYYNMKTIWFWKEIVKHGIKLLKISTTENLGDLFTDELPKPRFEHLRKIDGMLILWYIDAWEGVLIITLDIVCLVK